jgi:hypothetical protein
MRGEHQRLGEAVNSQLIVVIVVAVIITVWVIAAIRSSRRRAAALATLTPQQMAHQQACEAADTMIREAFTVGSQAVAAARKELRKAEETPHVASLAGCSLTATQLQANGRTHPITSATKARVEATGTVRGTKKNKVDTRELYVIVESDGWGEVITVKPDQGSEARAFAVQIGVVARDADSTRAMQETRIALARATLDQAKEEAAEAAAKATAAREKLGEEPLKAALRRLNDPSVAVPSRPMGLFSELPPVLQDPTKPSRGVTDPPPPSELPPVLQDPTKPSRGVTDPQPADGWQPEVMWPPSPSGHAGLRSGAELNPGPGFRRGGGRPSPGAAVRVSLVKLPAPRDTGATGRRAGVPVSLVKLPAPRDTGATGHRAGGPVSLAKLPAPRDTPSSDTPSSQTPDRHAGDTSDGTRRGVSLAKQRRPQFASP